MTDNKKKKSSKSKTKSAIKKEKNKINNVGTENKDSIWYGFIVVCVIIIIICLFYILAVHITNNNGETNKKTNTDDVNISYSEIIVGRTLSMNDKEYLVLLYNKNDSDISNNINESVSKYNEKEKHLNIYYVDMSSGLNKKYSGSESNVNPKKESEIVINGPTLMKVKNSKVTEYIEGIDNITDYLN